MKKVFGNQILEGISVKCLKNFKHNTLDDILCCFVISYRPTTGASMNPVRTLGPAVAANNYKAIWVYLTAPILGALCGAGIYSAVKLPQEDGGIHEKPSTTRSFRR